MIKRAKSGKIEDMMDKDTEQPVKSDSNFQWADMQIKDVLDVPATSSHILDVNLDDMDEEEIEVKR